MPVENFSFQCSLNIPVRHRKGESASSPVALLLHGYGQTGADTFEALENFLPSTWQLLAPNGPFPFFSSKQQKMVASWFFFDPKKREYLIGRETALLELEALLAQYTQPAQDLYVIGFSQGAYVAPYLALMKKKAKKVICINGRLRHEDFLQTKERFDILSLHGEKDETVEVINCLESANLLKQQGWNIDFRVIKDEGHELSPKLLAPLKELK